MVGRAPSLEDHFAAGRPKRILALDGGHRRGILCLGFLERIETLLRERHGNDAAFRLSHCFALIAGTSTGSIIAALLVRGQSVEEVIQLYLELADQVFSPRWWNLLSGILHPRYNPRDRATFLRRRLGPECTIGDPHQLHTGLVVMCKRINAGSPRAISNNPNGWYFPPNAADGVIANRDYRLLQVVRASTTAPTFFQPKAITISSPRNDDQTPLTGQFIDGGVSPHNNPALQAYWLAILKGYGLRWPVGQDQLLIISIGSGRTPHSCRPGWMAAMQRITALRGLMDDCAPSPAEMISHLHFSHECYDVNLFHKPTALDEQKDEPSLHDLGWSAQRLAQIRNMDNPTPKHQLSALGRVATRGKVLADLFTWAFDLPAVSAQPAASPQPTASPQPAVASQPAMSPQPLVSLLTFASKAPEVLNQPEAFWQQITSQQPEVSHQPEVSQELETSHPVTSQPLEASLQPLTSHLPESSDPSATPPPAPQPELAAAIQTCRARESSAVTAILMNLDPQASPFANGVARNAAKRATGSLIASALCTSWQKPSRMAMPSPRAPLNLLMNLCLLRRKGGHALR